MFLHVYDQRDYGRGCTATCKCMSLLTFWFRIALMARCTRCNIMWWKFASDLRKVGDFLRVLRFPPPIKRNATIYILLSMLSCTDHFLLEIFRDDKLARPLIKNIWAKYCCTSSWLKVFVCLRIIRDYAVTSLSTIYIVAFRFIGGGGVVGEFVSKFKWMFCRSWWLEVLAEMALIGSVMKADNPHLLCYWYFNSIIHAKFNHKKNVLT
jgi:hypothetical protein